MNFSRTCTGSTASRTACSDGDIAVKAHFHAAPQKLAAPTRPARPISVNSARWGALVDECNAP